MNTNYLKIAPFSCLNTFGSKWKTKENSLTSNFEFQNIIFNKSIRSISSLILFVLTMIPVLVSGQSSSTTFNTPGIFTWTAPTGVTSINVQLWGAGGGGAATGVANGSGGGGGGAYTNSTISVIPGTTYTLQVGAGGAKGTGCATPTDGANGTNSWFNDSTLLFANAGKGGKAPVGVGAGGIGGLGGTATAGAGITSYVGGAGSVGGVSIFLGPGGGGGGGSSAGTSASGVNGSPAIAAAAQTLGGGGGIAPPGGGYGGQGGGYNNMNGLLNGVDGFAPGGGGGGAGNGSNPSCIGLNTDGGNGAHGRIIITTGQTIFTQSGSWTAPACITSVIVEAWGGGGAGGGNETTDDGGGGGGGGAYSKSTVAVTPGQTYAVTIGTGGSGIAGGIGTNGGDSWFINATTILAKGGTGGNPPIAGAAGIPGLGGLASAGIGTTKYSGGNGGLGNDAAVGFGGGGGSSAGYTADGLVGGDATVFATVFVPAPGGIAPNGGGDGGDGQNTLLSGNGYSGFTPGGGGGGSSDIETGAGVAGGAGANGKVILSYPSASLVIGNNPVPLANVCANSLNIPIHSFTLSGTNSGCSNETDIRFVTTGTYTASEVVIFKLYYTTTNTFSTTNFLTSTAVSNGVGTHAFPSISRPAGSVIYYWITMDVANTVVDGHTLGVDGTLPTDITSTPVATGSSTPSGTQTLKASPILSSTLAAGSICSGTIFTYTPTTVASPATFTWTRATIAGITPAGTSNTGNVSELLSNTTSSPINVTYSYTVTSTSNGCSSGVGGENVIVTVNPNPQGSITGNSICGSDPASLGKLTWVSTAGTGSFTIDYNPGSVTESAVVSGTAFSVTPNPASTTTYTITSVTDANGCVTTSNFTKDTASIKVTGLAISITSHPSSTTICAGDVTTFSVTALQVNAYTWEVSTNNGGSWTDVAVALAPQPTYANSTTANLSLSATDAAHSGYVYRAKLTPACGAVTTSNTATLTVNAIPVLSSSTTTTSICSGTVFTYTPTSASTPSTITWSRATLADILEPGTSGSADINESLTNSSNVDVNVTYTITTTAKGCSNPAGEKVIVTVSPSLKLSSTLTPAAICSGTPFTYTPTTTSASPTFTWTRASRAGITPVGPTSGANDINETLVNNTNDTINVTYHYDITNSSCASGGIGENVVVTVNPGVMLDLTSAPGSNIQSVCVNTPIDVITYTVSGSGVNATATGLPVGVNGNFNAGEFTINGTPSVPGVYPFSVTASGSCPQTVLTGTITVGISLISAIGSNDQYVCLNTAIDTIRYAIGGAGESASATGLPAGITGTFSSGEFIITGTPTVAGGFNYTVSTSGTCAVAKAYGKITVGLSLISAVGTDSQNVCLGDPIANVTYKIVSPDVLTPATVLGLPPGVSGSVTGAGIFTILGTPLVEGLHTYTVHANGSCSSQAFLIGKILVSIGKISGIGTDSQKVCKSTPIQPIVYTYIGATSPIISGLPSGVSGSQGPGPNKFTIAGTPLVEGAFTYTISAQGSCAALAPKLTGKIIIGIGLTSAVGTDSQKVCKNLPIKTIKYFFKGGIIPTPPTIAWTPAANGLTGAVINDSIFTITGTPNVAGLITYTITAKGACGNASVAKGKVIVGIGLISATGTDKQAPLCKNTAKITPIVYSIVGGGANVATGLPKGVAGITTKTGDPAIFTISGTPSAAGIFTYTVTSSGGSCMSTFITGTLTVNETTISRTSDTTSSDQTLCFRAHKPIIPITFKIGGKGTGANIAPPLPTGIIPVITATGVTISGTPTDSTQLGALTYTVTTTGTCNQVISKFKIAIWNPIAKFTADTLTGVSPLLVNFKNESTDANTYHWILGDGLESGVETPSNGYIKPGTYSVVLTATWDSLCASTDTATVVIAESFHVVIPNVFTPNGDNRNDIFYPVGDDIKSVNMEVYNRWGLKLFESTTIYGGWDGRNSKTGLDVPDGTYFYIIRAIGNNGKEINTTGFISLTRE